MTTALRVDPVDLPSSGPNPQPQPKREYRRVIDLLRFLAAVGIVLDHGMGWAVVGYPALGLFLILTAYFGVGSYRRAMGQEGQGGGFWSNRAKRMLVPWLFWCAFYRLVWEVVSDEPFQLLSDPFTLLIGPSIHLWFLPFAALAMIFIPAIARDVERVPQLVLASVILVPLSIALGLIHAKSGLEGWLISDGPIVPPVPQWAFSLPIFIWGALAAVAHRLGRPEITLAAAFVSSAVLLALDWDVASIQLILCAVIFEIGYRLRWQGQWMTDLAGYAFGLYLLHPFFMLVGYKIFGADGGTAWPTAVALFGAWGATWLCKRLPVVKGML
ncbi:acyltransferase [Xinfangfangia sp. CPCC 101601]|uniref:Acyltransferase n=1 Tax=Pseudogemmobacter lacusdianii TaxID=3069608 RepID=A0ABU0W0G9_9RHOB|nr:acyltransferase [Xinfangfangia sp. CPCC 101601]MDQ2066615.1 acyltransferase [Xinfangfangia sp. CPCC 101601]